MTPSQQTEKLVLGSCLEDPTIDFVVRWCRPEYFELDSHRRIFKKICTMHQAGMQVNASTLTIEFGAEVSTVGGTAYLCDLNLGIPFGLNEGIKTYTDRLKDAYKARRMFQVCQSIEPGMTPAQMALKLQQALSENEETISDSTFFSSFADFATSEAREIDWVLGGIIERGANGFIAAEPKGSKSFCTADLCIALATGSSWLGFPVPRPVKVGMVSREDNPSLTAWRMRHLMEGRELDPVQLGYLDRNLYINTRRQTPTFMLDNDSEVRELISVCRERKIEFLFLDVLNILHKADENDNTQMAEILRKVKWLSQETKAQIGILHHYKKEDSGRITTRLRGASAIAGFAEWVIGISMSDEEARVRKMEFELKAGNPPESIYFVIDAQESKPAKIQRISTQTKQQRRAN